MVTMVTNGYAIGASKNTIQPELEKTISSSLSAYRRTPDIAAERMIDLIQFY